MKPSDCRQYIDDVIKRIVPPFLWHKDRLQLLVEEEIIKTEILSPRTQSIKESIAVVSANPKTAALYFDRVNYLPLPPEHLRIDIPIGIVNELSTANSFKVNFCAELAHYLHSEADPVNAIDESLEILEATELLLPEVQKYDLVGRDCPYKVNMCNRHAMVLSQEFGVTAIPIYNCEESMRQEFKPGKAGIIIQLIQGLELVDESQLSWEQVIEFRFDETSRKNYRRFLHWLEGEMQGHSPQYICDELEEKYDAYKKALRKHGIKICLGLFSDLFKGDFLVSTASVAAVSAYIINPEFAIVAASGLTIGKLTIKLIQDYMDYQSTKEIPSSIAWIYDIKQIQVEPVVGDERGAQDAF